MTKIATYTAQMMATLNMSISYFTSKFLTESLTARVIEDKKNVLNV
jgi:hypothetical protein